MQTTSVVYGRFPVIACLKSNKHHPRELCLQTDLKSNEAVDQITQLARSLDLPILYQPRQQLEEKFQLRDENHQGVVLTVSEYRYASLERILDTGQNLSPQDGTPQFLLLLDHIQDPHNMGALIRSAEIAGCQAVIIPKDRSSDINSTVIKTSAGATEHINISQVTNLNRCIDQLKQSNIWVIGLESGGQSIYNTDLTVPIALVVGSEGKGLSKLTLEKCDLIAHIPMAGETPSLNASVAGGIALFEAVRQRSL